MVRSSRRKTPSGGDIIRIPLSDGRYAYTQYIGMDDALGPVLQVFSFFSTTPLTAEDLPVVLEPLFPPIVVGILPPLRSGRWEIVGSRAFDAPKRLHFLYGTPDRNGQVAEWALWENGHLRELGPPPVPLALQDVEWLATWPGELVEERLETGSTGDLQWFWKQIGKVSSG
jgi:hypothetical protein